MVIHRLTACSSGLHNDPICDISAAKVIASSALLSRDYRACHTDSITSDRSAWIVLSFCLAPLQVLASISDQQGHSTLFGAKRFDVNFLARLVHKTSAIEIRILHKYIYTNGTVIVNATRRNLQAAHRLVHRSARHYVRPQRLIWLGMSAVS